MKILTVRSKKTGAVIVCGTLKECGYELKMKSKQVSDMIRRGGTRGLIVKVEEVIYKFYDESNGNLLAEGTPSEIAEAIPMSLTSVYAMVQSGGGVRTVKQKIRVEKRLREVNEQKEDN